MRSFRNPDTLFLLRTSFKLFCFLNCGFELLCLFNVALFATQSFTLLELEKSVSDFESVRMNNTVEGRDI
jgi:hypothetical protein